MFKRIKRGFVFLANPSKGFKQISNETLESSLENYIKLILLSGFFAGLTNFVYRLIRAIIFDVFEGVSVNYWHLINYTLSISSGIFFFYLFIGTFGVGFTSIILNIFFKRKFATLVKILMYSLLPVILIGWISIGLGVSMLFWSLILFITGLKLSK